MTDITPEDTQTSLDGSQGAQEPPSGDAADPPQDPLGDDAEESDRTANNREAAKFRTALRKAEAQIAAMAEQITGYQRKACEDVIADLLAQPADVWLFGDQPNDFYADGDVLQEDKLRAAVAGLLDKRPGLRKTARQAARQWGQHGQATPTEVGWAGIIQQQR